MAVISLAEARGVYTSKLQAIYQERIAPTSFLRSFFTPKESNTKYITIAVQRGKEMVAVDVQRGTEGNRNVFSKSSEKTFLPPYFEEFFEATELDFYDKMWNDTGDIDAPTFAKWLEQTVERLDDLIYKIERSYELLASQVLTTGVAQLSGNINIDFNRKAASLVANAAGNTWATGTVNPYKNLEDGCNFIRTKGKSVGTIYNCIMGSEAFNDFMANDIVKGRNNLTQISLDSIRKPQRVSDATLHGEISAGSYKLRVWTYNEFYDTASTANNPYIDPKKVIILPENPNFILAYAGVPTLMVDQNNVGIGLSPKKGRYHVSEHLDARKASHIISVKSAGLPVPVAVDQIYTVQVVA